MKRNNVKLIAQPTSYDCQATCIAMACGGTQQTVTSIYDSLCQHGVPGDPGNINAELTYRLRGVADVSLKLNASLNDIMRYLSEGALLITHGYFTESGHVLCIKDRFDNGGFEVLDPWTEFDGRMFCYSSLDNGFQGEYSQLLIYAACVTSYSYEQALSAYESMSLNTAEQGAWVHIIRYHDDRDDNLQDEIADIPTTLEAGAKHV